MHRIDHFKTTSMWTYDKAEAVLGANTPNPLRRRQAAELCLSGARHSPHTHVLSTHESPHIDLWALPVQNPRLAVAFATVQVVHPGHPTAVGGLPLS